MSFSAFGAPIAAGLNLAGSLTSGKKDQEKFERRSEIAEAVCSFYPKDCLEKDYGTVVQERCSARGNCYPLLGLYRAQKDKLKSQLENRALSVRELELQGKVNPVRPASTRSGIPLGLGDKGLPVIPLLITAIIMIVIVKKK